VKRIQDVFSKEKFQQEVAEEIAKDLRKNTPSAATNNNRPR